jgi:hypothetical protein
MSCPVAYPVAWSRPAGQAFAEAGRARIRPGTDVHLCSSLFLSATGEGWR